MEISADLLIISDMFLALLLFDECIVENTASSSGDDVYSQRKKSGSDSMMADGTWVL